MFSCLRLTLQMDIARAEKVREVYKCLSMKFYFCLMCRKPREFFRIEGACENDMVCWKWSKNSNGSKRHKEHRNKIEILDPDAYKDSRKESRENSVKPERFRSAPVTTSLWVWNEPETSCWLKMHMCSSLNVGREQQAAGVLIVPLSWVASGVIIF